MIGYDASKYETDRVWITARDGVKVPVSLVYRKGYQKDGKGALFQYAYGSYGMSMDPYFNQTAVSLLDRGVVYAIAHIRGARKWAATGTRTASCCTSRTPSTTSSTSPAAWSHRAGRRRIVSPRPAAAPVAC